jgi:hypothetical protein
MKRINTASLSNLVWIPMILGGLSLLTMDSRIGFNLMRLWTSPAQLTHDFMTLYGVSAALMNAAILMGLNLVVLKLAKVEMTGFVVATLFTVLGFSFIGITPINAIPLYLGALIYDQFSELEFTNIIVVVMMGTSLGPVVSHVASLMVLGLWRFPLALGAGMVCGLYLVPMTKLVYPWHNGFNLYNVGFTTGIMGMVVQVVLTSFGMGSSRVKLLTETSHWALDFSAWIVIAGFIVLAIHRKDITKQAFKELVQHGGKAPADFWSEHPRGVVFMNMAIMGAFGMIITSVVGGVINGPIMAAIFSMIGFGAFGKHPVNSWAPMVGAGLMALVLGKSPALSGVMSIILFTSCLAPITLHFGIGWGLVAGALHLLLAPALGDIHGGLNLYNNGYTAGVVASFLLLNAHLLRKDLKLTKK